MHSEGTVFQELKGALQLDEVGSWNLIEAIIAVALFIYVLNSKAPSNAKGPLISK